MEAADFAWFIAGLGWGIVFLGAILWLIERYFDG